MKLVIVTALLVPFIVIIWLCNVFFNIYKRDAEPVSPVRILIATVAPLLVAQWGLRRRSLDISGAVAGVVIGFILTLSNLCFFSSLLMFFVTASKATKYKQSEKKKFEDGYKEGGQRNWVQVFCNGGIASEFALFYLINEGCTEKLINFKTQFTASLFAMSTMGALCCSCGDTFSSEIGSVFGRGKDARLITDLWRKVPRGTNGGVSLVGSLASLVGGGLVGLAYYVTLILLSDPYYVKKAPAQWLLVPAGASFGLVGSTVDSLLGATQQYSGYDKTSGRVVELPGPNVEYICGSERLNNHGVNLLSSIITGFLAPSIACYIWSFNT